jgi:hypothetical protein
MKKPPTLAGRGLSHWWLVLLYLSALCLVLVETGVLEVSLDDGVIALIILKTTRNLQVGEGEREGDSPAHLLLTELRGTLNVIDDKAPHLVPVKPTLESVPQLTPQVRLRRESPPSSIGFFSS